MALRTFGGLGLVPGGGRAPGAAATQRRRLALLAVLAAAGATGMSREKLMSLFWPENDEPSARRALNQALYALRSAFPADDLFVGSSTLQLNHERLPSDVAEFLHALESGEPARAAQAYRGPFLDGVHLQGAPEFERWVDAERESLQRRYLEAVTQLATAAEAAQAHADAAAWWRRRVEALPFESAAVVSLMRTLAASGDVAGALAHARVYAARLEAELGLPPDDAVLALAQELRTRARTGGGVPATPAPQQSSVSGTSGAQGIAPAAEAMTPSPVNTVHAGTDSVGGDEVGARAPTTAPARRDITRRAGAVALVALAVTITASTLFLRNENAPPQRPLDSHVVAIAPFTVLDPELALWREGMVDLLSQSLDGAGPLRVVPPTVALRRAEPGAVMDAEALGRRTGAGVVLTGSVLRAGDDAIRVAITLLETGTARPLGSVERRGQLDRIDLLVDSLTVDVLREMDEWMPLGAARGTRIRPARSVEALRAFLRGEQYYRRLRWDSAVSLYARALEHDSTFALAAWRLGTVLSWQRLSTDTMAETWLLRAGAMNRGLSPRDSILVAADSLAAAANELPTFAAAWPYTRRLFVTLGNAAERYPDDPEVWHAVGEARYHFGTGPLIGVSDSAVLDAFDRAIALDSAFAPAYVHAPELALLVHGRDAARRYLDAYLSLDARPAEHRGLQLLARLLRARDGAGLGPVLDTASADALFPARTALRRWPDPDETALRLTRLLRTPGRRTSYAGFTDSALTRRLLSEQLAFRGRLREAAEVIGDRDAPIFPELAYLGALPEGVAAAALRQRVLQGSRWTNPALSYWSERRDTTSLGIFRDSARARLTRATSLAPRSTFTYDTAAVQAHLALARGDSAGALARFVALPDTLCPRCYTDRLTRGRLLFERGRHREALSAFSEPLVAMQSPMEVLFAVHRARAATELRRRPVAERAYALVADAWLHADPALRAYVLEARRSRSR